MVPEASVFNRSIFGPKAVVCTESVIPAPMAVRIAPIAMTKHVRHCSQGAGFQRTDGGKWAVA